MKIDLPYPHKALWPNGRAHWGTKATQTKKHRQWASLATVEALQGGCRLPGGRIPITIHCHAKPKGPLPDKDNVIAACKAMLDGIADELEVDDSRFDIRGVQFATPRDGRMVIEVGA